MNIRPPFTIIYNNIIYPVNGYVKENTDKKSLTFRKCQAYGIIALSVGGCELVYLVSLDSCIIHCQLNSCCPFIDHCGEFFGLHLIENGILVCIEVGFIAEEVGLADNVVDLVVLNDPEFIVAVAVEYSIIELYGRRV